MDVDYIPIKWIDGPPAEGDPNDELNEFSGAMEGSDASNSSWSSITPMTGSHVPGVDTGARGGQTTFMGGGGQVETIGSGGGSFGGNASGGSTPYASIMRNHLLGQLPPRRFFCFR